MLARSIIVEVTYRPEAVTIKVHLKTNFICACKTNQPKVNGVEKSGSDQPLASSLQILWLPERVRLPRLAFRQSYRFGELRQRLRLGASREASQRHCLYEPIALDHA